MNSCPKINAEKAAEEVKKHLDDRKLELIDWGLFNIETYPDPTDHAYPELKGFAEMWENFFAYADSVTDEDGSGFPHEAVKNYEAETDRIQELVNDDEEFWTRLREEVMPLYKLPGNQSDSGVLLEFECLWGKIRHGIFFDDSDKELVTSLSPIDDMRHLLTSYASLGKRAKTAFEELRPDIVLSDREFMALCKAYADKLMLEKWQERWKAVEIFYDPVPMEVVTTQMWTNQETGKRTRGEVLSKRKLPAGFVIKVL